jgi:hypothetical protein
MNNTSISIYAGPTCALQLGYVEGEFRQDQAFQILTQDWNWVVRFMFQAICLRQNATYWKLVAP